MSEGLAQENAALRAQLAGVWQGTRRSHARKRSSLRRTLGNQPDADHLISAVLTRAIKE